MSNHVASRHFCGRHDWIKKPSGFLAGLGLALGFVLGLAILYSAYCGWTHFMLGHTSDFARYTNALWNTAHGQWFRYNLGQQSLLRFHLSFSLALVSPLLRLWDSPFALLAIQWASAAAGAFVIGITGRRIGAAAHECFALAALYIGCHFTQGMLVCGFYGMTFYMLLIPLLYYCILFRRSWVFPVTAILVGLREDAGLIFAPMLAYLAASRRDKLCAAMSFFCVLYAIFALWFFYPEVNGMTIAAERVNTFIAPDVRSWLASFVWRPRIQAFVWIALFALPYIVVKPRPVIAFTITPLLQAFGSLLPNQYGLHTHYSASVISVLIVSFLETQRQATASNGRSATHRRIAYILALTTASACLHGFTFGSIRDCSSIYTTINADGRDAISVARHHLPRTGALTTEHRLAAFVANRKSLVYADLLPADKALDTADVVFCHVGKLTSAYREQIEAGLWNVHYQDERYVVLVRNASVSEVTTPSNIASAAR